MDLKPKPRCWDVTSLCMQYEKWNIEYLEKSEVFVRQVNGGQIGINIDFPNSIIVKICVHIIYFVDLKVCSFLFSRLVHNFDNGNFHS